MRTFLLIAALIAPTACTSTITAFTDEGTGGGSSGTGTGSGSGSGSTGSGQQCLGFDDTNETTQVTVTVRNTTDEAIYLTGLGCDSQIDLELYDANDREVSYRRGNCHFTCAELQNTDPVCAGGCAIPPIIMIAPGGSYDLSWDGTLHEPTEMPASCYFSSDFASPTCDVRISAPEGSYAFEVVGYDDSWCPIDLPGGCECEPNAQGNCQVDEFAEIFTEGRSARGQLEFPKDLSAEIVF